MSEAFPLRWPPGRPRTRPERRQEAPIEAAFAVAVRRAMAEVNLLPGRGPILSLDLPLGLDGRPLEGHRDRQPGDPGAALYFGFEGERHCVSCDFWQRVEDNVQAIAFCIESLRRLQRSAGFEVLRQAMKGFYAPYGRGEAESWWNVLGVAFDAPLYAAEAAYRQRVLRAHPDRGGSDEAMMRLNAAIAEARLQLKDSSL
jgi:hypothetical protein